MIDWENIHCPVCNEKKKQGKNNKVWFDRLLSDKSKGKMVFYCTNHPSLIHFVTEVFDVNNAIISVRQYVFTDRKPKK